MSTPVGIHEGVVLDLQGADTLAEALGRWCAAIRKLAAADKDPESQGLGVLARVERDISALLARYAPVEEGLAGGEAAPAHLSGPDVLAHCCTALEGADLDAGLTLSAGDLEGAAPARFLEPGRDGQTGSSTTGTPGVVPLDVEEIAAILYVRDTRREGRAQASWAEAADEEVREYRRSADFFLARWDAGVE